MATPDYLKTTNEARKRGVKPPLPRSREGNEHPPMRLSWEQPLGHPREGGSVGRPKPEYRFVRRPRGRHRCPISACSRQPSQHNPLFTCPTPNLLAWDVSPVDLSKIKRLHHRGSEIKEKFSLSSVFSGRQQPFLCFFTILSNHGRKRGRGVRCPRCPAAVMGTNARPCVCHGNSHWDIPGKAGQ
jgi:hypothetical protein